jgi:hypothetical protein
VVNRLGLLDRNLFAEELSDVSGRPQKSLKVSLNLSILSKIELCQNDRMLKSNDFFWLSEKTIDEYERKVHARRFVAIWLECPMSVRFSHLWLSQALTFPYSLSLICDSSAVPASAEYQCLDAEQFQSLKAIDIWRQKRQQRYDRHQLSVKIISQWQRRKKE